MLANSLYFQHTNRYRVFDVKQALPLLLRSCESGDPRVVQHAVRALGSASANNHVAAAIAKLGGIAVIVAVAQSTNAECCRFAAFALTNLALFDPNKKLIVAAGGMEAIVKLQAHNDDKVCSVKPRWLWCSCAHCCLLLFVSYHSQVRQQAMDCAEILGDLATPAEMEALRKGFDVEGLLRLLEADSPTVKGMALDSLVEEAEKGGLAVATQVASAGGLVVLTDLCRERCDNLEDQGSAGLDVDPAEQARREQVCVWWGESSPILLGLPAHIRNRACVCVRASGQVMRAAAQAAALGDERAAVIARAEASTDAVLVRAMWALRVVLKDHESNMAAFGSEGVPTMLDVSATPPLHVPRRQSNVSHGTGCVCVYVLSDCSFTVP